MARRRRRRLLEGSLSRWFRLGWRSCQKYAEILQQIGFKSAVREEMGREAVAQQAEDDLLRKTPYRYISSPFRPTNKRRA